MNPDPNPNPNRNNPSNLFDTIILLDTTFGSGGNIYNPRQFLNSIQDTCTGFQHV